MGEAEAAGTRRVLRAAHDPERGTQVIRRGFSKPREQGSRGEPRGTRLGIRRASARGQGCGGEGRTRGEGKRGTEGQEKGRRSQDLGGGLRTKTRGGRLLVMGLL